VVVVGGCVVVVAGGWVVGGDVGWVTGGITGVAGVELELDVEVGVVVLVVEVVGVLVAAAGAFVVVGVDEDGAPGVAVAFGAVVEIRADDLPLDSTANQSFSTPCPVASPFLSLAKV
jgi:hypothetical protein